MGGHDYHRIDPIRCVLRFYEGKQFGDFFDVEIKTLPKLVGIAPGFHAALDLGPSHERKFLFGLGIYQTAGREGLINPFHPQAPIPHRPECVEFFLDGYGGDFF